MLATMKGTSSEERVASGTEKGRSSPVFGWGHSAIAKNSYNDPNVHK